MPKRKDVTEREEEEFSLGRETSDDLPLDDPDSDYDEKPKKKSAAKKTSPAKTTKKAKKAAGEADHEVMACDHPRFSPYSPHHAHVQSTPR